MSGQPFAVILRQLDSGKLHMRLWKSGRPRLAAGRDGVRAVLWLAILAAGDAELRRLLYLCAQASVRTTGSPFAQQHERERAKGLASTEVLDLVPLANFLAMREAAMGYAF